MVAFEKMWATFVDQRGSFDPFMDLYLERWLHSFVILASFTNLFFDKSEISDQVVTLTTVDPPLRVRIVGITPEFGLLRTMSEDGSYWDNRGEPFIDLQPDGNSFDMMAGLIKVKT